MKRLGIRMAAGGLLAAWMVVIFLFSHQPAATSEKISGTVSFRLLEQADTIFQLGWDKAELEDRAERIDYPVRKAAHMTEYAVLAVISFGFFGSMGKTGRKNYLYGFLFSVCYAVTDEIHQLFVPGRAGRFFDVCVDGTGAACGLLLLFIFRKIWRKCCGKQRHLIQ